MCIGLYVTCPLFLSYFIETWIFSADFRKIPKFNIREYPSSGCRVLDALRRSQNSSVALSQVMNYGFLNTTTRQNAEVGNGILQTLTVPRMREWANPKSNRCSLFFWHSGDRPQGICPTRINSSSNFLTGIRWKSEEMGGTCATRHSTHLNAVTRQRPISHGSFHLWIFGR